MNKIGIFFGSDTGNTEKIAKIIYKKIGTDIAELFDIANAKIEDINRFDILIFGVPTWYYGEVQCDWDEFLPNLKKINFKNKIVALFGCGDQEDYSEYFCDGIGILYHFLIKKNATIIGKWPNEGYQFESSKALMNDKEFFGLIIDEDRQQEKSLVRINKWLQQILYEINKIEKFKMLNITI
ncbi:flavodoxin FldA [Buchnera aphidicola]|uniref:flavodoxin FldA n=1 Tax=Buchnera aphidicola TaxID=9 RepID=UPI0034647E1A